MFGSEVSPSPGTYFHSVGGELPLPGAQVPIFPVVGISLSVSQPAISCLIWATLCLLSLPSLCAWAATSCSPLLLGARFLFLACTHQSAFGHQASIKISALLSRPTQHKPILGF